MKKHILCLMRFGCCLWSELMPLCILSLGLLFIGALCLFTAPVIVLTALSGCAFGVWRVMYSLFTDEEARGIVAIIAVVLGAVPILGGIVIIVLDLQPSSETPFYIHCLLSGLLSLFLVGLVCGSMPPLYRSVKIAPTAIKKCAKCSDE